MIAISVFSLLRETLDQSWPLWRVVAHVAILAVSGLLMTATLRYLHRGSQAEAQGPQGKGRRVPAARRVVLRQPHLQ